ncbi:MAG: GNAT family N-acetyltransferase [Acidimicrobiales bacterium]
MPVRPASLDDFGEVCSLIRELAAYERMADQISWDEEGLADRLFGPDAVPRIHLAVTGAGEVAGFALWFPTFSTFLGRPGIWLEDLFVREAHRGQGHGRALLDHLRAATGGRVEWNVLDWNRPAMAFYDSLGAAPVPGWTRYRWLPAPGQQSHPA